MFYGSLPQVSFTQSWGEWGIFAFSWVQGRFEISTRPLLLRACVVFKLSSQKCLIPLFPLNPPPKT